MSIVSQNIKYLRRLNGLTQEQFSRRIGIKRSLVGAYEEARANPPLDKLKVIANCFGISVDTLIKQDVRKIKQTPDLNFDEQKPPQPIRDVAADFLNKIQPQPEIPVPPPSVFPKVEPPVVPPPIPNFSSPPPAVIQQVSGTMRLVPLHQQTSYVKHHEEENFILELPAIHFPIAEEGILRAFALGEDFPISPAIAFARKVFSWDELKEGVNYVLVTRQHGIIYRRVYNQLKVKGTFLLSSDVHTIPSKEVSGTELLETWEVIGYFSQKIPQPSASFDKLENMVDELRFEVERLKKRN